MTGNTRYVCAACETAGDVPLYHFGRDNGHSTEIAHGCEHYIHDSYPSDPPPREWLGRNAVPPGASCIMTARAAHLWPFGVPITDTDPRCTQCQITWAEHYSKPDCTPA